jgi:uncharacterized membrane protein
MSLQSGRKLGLAASLIQIIIPVIAVIVVVIAIVYMIASIPATLTGPNPTLPNFSFLYLGFVAVLVLVGIVTFIGIILFIIAMHSLSHYYNEPGIFKNALYGFILNIVGSIVAVVVEFVFVLRSIGSLSPSSTLPAAVTPTPPLPPLTSIFAQFVLGFLAVLAVGFVLAIISAVLYMRAFNKLAEKSGIDNFRTAGLLYLLGQVLAIVLVGALLVWIGWIFAAMGFNSIKPKEPPPPTLVYTTSQTTMPTIKKIYCPNCGTENDANATYCKYCGRKLQ